MSDLDVRTVPAPGLLYIVNEVFASQVYINSVVENFAIYPMAPFPLVVYVFVTVLPPELISKIRPIIVFAFVLSEQLNAMRFVSSCTTIGADENDPFEYIFVPVVMVVPDTVLT